MKTKILFEWIARTLSVLVVMVNLLSIPTQNVFAKSLATFTGCASQTEIPEAECNVLVDFYNNTDGANWINHTDWLQTDTPCSWYGITCSSGTHVTKLELRENSVSGAFPSTLSNLAELTVLDLYDNSLTGPIPPQLANLTHLTVLSIPYNELTGSIPIALTSMTNLTELSLDGNVLIGTIPLGLGNLTHLTTLGLSGNGLDGSIPTQLGNLTNLTDLYLHSNGLSGSIPTQLGNLVHLTFLSLGFNGLTGPIPTQFGNLTSLTSLDLSENQLSGPILPQLGSLTNLTDLELSDNQLTGSIPPQLGNLTNLTELRLNNNKLSGSIPTQIGNLTNLTGLYLSENQLSGSIPTQLGNLTNLAELYLDRNKLSGSMPTQLGNLINLKTLELIGNKLVGEFPTSITNLVNLTQFEFDCTLTSSNPDVINFLDLRFINWQIFTCPAVVSIKRNDPSPTILPSVKFTVTFSEPVYDVDIHDFSLTASGVSGASITGVGGEGETRTVTVSTGTGHGSIRLNLIDNNSIFNTLFNELGGTVVGDGNFTTGETYISIKDSILTLNSIAAQDGWILESSENSNVGGILNSAASIVNLGDDATRKQYRGILSFATAPLPDNAVITGVTLKIKQQAVVGGNLLVMFQGLIVDIKTGSFGTAVLQTTDFQATANKAMGPFSPSLTSGWYNLNLANGKTFINKLSTNGGLTQIRLRFNLDDNNNTVANYLSLFSGNAPAADRPQLVITYHLP